MELFDDWGGKELIPRYVSKGPEGGAASQSLGAAIHERLAKFKPHIINVHCYEDVGYPWVQVVFEDLIEPGVALRVGDELVQLAGERVYLNSLRPRAVYFILKPSSGPQPDLPVERYGERLDTIEGCWSRPGKKTRSRARPRDRSGPVDRAEARPD